MMRVKDSPVAQEIQGERLLTSAETTSWMMRMDELKVNVNSRRREGEGRRQKFNPELN